MEVATDNSKPVPIPRNRGAQDSQNNNTTNAEVNIKGVNNSKPVPLPRKLLQRLSSGDRKKGKKDKISSLIEETNQNVSTLEEIVLSDDVKRGTINIFKRGRTIDPFEEFEKEFVDPHPLRSVSFSSPELPDEVRTSFHSMSSSLNCSDSDSSDYYNQLGPSVETSIVYEPVIAPAKPTRRLNTMLSKSTENNSSAENKALTSEEITPFSQAKNLIPVVFNSIDHENMYENSVRQVPSASSSPSIRSVGNVTELTPIKDRKCFYEVIHPKLKDDFDCNHLNSNYLSRTASLPSTEISKLKGTKTNQSSRLSEGSNPCSSASRTRENTYDDVTLEDGTVVFLDNQLNTIPKLTTNDPTELSKFTSSQKSIVMEFDPLFKSTSEKFHSLNSLDDELEEGAELLHPYEELDNECNSSKIIKIPSLADTHAENTKYLNLAINLEAPQSDSNQLPHPLSPVDEENYEDVVPQTREDPKDNRGILEVEDKDVQDPPSTVSGNWKRSDTGGGSFLRRLSHKIRLIPIREESLGHRRSSSDSLATSSRCVKCGLEHTDSGTCKFTPVVRHNIVFSSNLYRPSGIVQKDFTKRWVVLSNGKLSVYNDKKVVVEDFLLEKGTLILKKNDNKVAATGGVQLKPFEIVFGNGKNALLLAAATEAERASWMQKWAEVFISVLPSHVISDFDRGGWCFIKETVTSEWYPSWMILKGRTLIHGFAGGAEYFELDLRKARSVVLNTKDTEQKCTFVENAEVLTVDMISKILFIQTEVVKVTNTWAKVVGLAATQNGANFDEMQLTMDDIPVIVDKCIDFLYAHGTLAEGIYRQSGSNTRISQLLADFQKDSWSVQISHKEFSAHDVAGTLKRFFRTLPDALFTTGLYSSWIATSRMVNEDMKMKTYEDLLHALPPINRNILKKLICHLYAVHELHEKNLMPLNNLAPIWGPTLMNVESPLKVGQTTAAESDDQYRTACAESEVVKDLIRNYYVLFRVDEVAREREKKMQDALENFHLGAMKRKCSGDMKIWIYIWEKDESTAINITLTPQGTAHTIVHQLCRMAQLRNYENLSIHEVICGNSLERPLHPSEIVIETVLRWSIWDIDERKNNYLILKKNTLYPALIPYAKDPTAVYGDFKFADSKTKSFKKFAFKFGRAMLKYYKNSKASTELGSWNIEDIVWYLGTESKRTPTPRWAFTFVKRNYPFKRSKEEPYFGNVVSCTSEEDLYKWIAAMVIGEHPAGLYPSIIV